MLGMILKLIGKLGGGFFGVLDFGVLKISVCEPQ